MQSNLFIKIKHTTYTLKNIVNIIQFMLICICNLQPQHMGWFYNETCQIAANLKNYQYEFRKKSLE